MALDPFVSSLQHTVLRTIHTSVVRRHNKQCSHKRNSNIFHASMFCATEDSTVHTAKGGRSRDAQKWPKHNVSEQLRASYKLSDFI